MCLDRYRLLLWWQCALASIEMLHDPRGGLKAAAQPRMRDCYLWSFGLRLATAWLSGSRLTCGTSTSIATAAVSRCVGRSAHSLGCLFLATVLRLHIQSAVLCCLLFRGVATCGHFVGWPPALSTGIGRHPRLLHTHLHHCLVSDVGDPSARTAGGAVAMICAFGCFYS